MLSNLHQLYQFSLFTTRANLSLTFNYAHRTYGVDAILIRKLHAY